jgi:hypothetical protein
MTGVILSNLICWPILAAVTYTAYRFWRGPNPRSTQ